MESSQERSRFNAKVVELPAQVVDGIEPTAGERDGGIFFPVWLRWLPRVGELIRLNSRMNAATGHVQMRLYEVVRIVHHVDDVNEDAQSELERRGSHFADVYVRLSNDKLFEQYDDERADDLDDGGPA